MAEDGYEDELAGGPLDEEGYDGFDVDGDGLANGATKGGGKGAPPRVPNVKIRTFYGNPKTYPEWKKKFRPR